MGGTFIWDRHLERTMYWSSTIRTELRILEVSEGKFEGGEARHIHLLLDILFLCHVAGNAIMLLCDFREPAVIHVGVHLQEKQLSVNHAATLKERFNRLLHLFFRTLCMRW